jgi:hypothetical protein
MVIIVLTKMALHGGLGNAQFLGFIAMMTDQFFSRVVFVNQ